MAKPSFTADLERYGPNAPPPAKPISRFRSRRYCRRLARRHYENFTVGSYLLPRGLRQHVYNIYAYCRWADDLADEAEDSQKAASLLNWWAWHLRECYAGRTTHPVFIALADTIARFEIPADPFLDLLIAFRQDQFVKRYETIDQLLDYCRYSANPVGRLFLYLGRCHTPELVTLSDTICTGLQMVNFWQDLAEDWDRGRIYLPQTHCRYYGYTEEMFARRESNEAFQHLLAREVADAEGWLRRGMPLVTKVPEELQLDIALFIHGGLRAIEEIRKQDYDVWPGRPFISRWQKMRLALSVWWRLRRGTLLESHGPANQAAAKKSPLG